MESRRVVNFAAGPSKLPEAVLKHAAGEMSNYEGHGVGVMELSHRSAEFANIMHQVDKNVRELMNVPENYEVMLMQGGGTGQFAAVAMNLIGLKEGKTADYIITGTWSAKAAKEAEKYGTVRAVLPKTSKYTDIPVFSAADISPEASYVYYCANETVHGVEFQHVPEVPAGVPLVCDMSSNVLSRQVDVSKFGVIYAGAQKNIGCAGVTLVIVRKDLLGKELPYTPLCLSYKTTADAGSLYNTPPCYSIYIMNLVFDWLRAQGGVPAIEERNRRKSSLVYDTIAQSGGFYCAVVEPAARSRMNVPFRVGGPQGDEALEKKFLEEAKKVDLVQLKGHRSVGGLRASLYNALSVEEVQQLVDFMEHFQQQNQQQ